MSLKKTGISLIAVAAGMVWSNTANAQANPCTASRVDGETIIECEGDISSGLGVTEPNDVIVKIDELPAGISPADGTPGVRVLAGSNNAGLPGVTGFATELGSVEVPFVRDAANTQNGAFGGDAPSATLEYGQSVGITTAGDFAHGLIVASLGGAANPGSEDKSTFSATGGRGGDGGDGGTVVITSLTSITTVGATAHGIFGISEAGVAGDGGFASAFSADGGDGGTGGDGGSVSITSSGDITTGGTGAYGLYGLNLSGNGGNGAKAEGAKATGGNGGNAGNAGAVTITNNATFSENNLDGGRTFFGGNITTSADDAHSIFGASFGGNGGNGGGSGGLVADGGDGSTSGVGGVVTITNGSGLLTRGANAFGILAQSIGGGAGNGGSSGGLGSVGGESSQSANGGLVSVTNTGVIETFGQGSFGVQAQSIGGGGGSGGSSGGLFSVGGSGDAGGSANSVLFTNSGRINTVDDQSDGVLLQSIGGGGGSGAGSGGLISIGSSGASSGDGGSIIVNQTEGWSITQGDGSRALVAQSIGGGGGHGGGSGGAISIGGSGGGEGSGGAVTLSLTGGLFSTEGDHAFAVLAQSIGGGGGTGLQLSGDGASGAGGSSGGLISVGGKGGSGGDGGTIDIDNAARISTGGLGSNALTAQSIGGGGGHGGGSGGVVSVGGNGGGGGDGGSVAASNAGTISTIGNDSTGIHAHSVGNGGGSGGFSVAGGVIVSAAVGGNGGAGGDGAKVSVDNSVSDTASIVTQGDRSRGIDAQSIGGGGGNGGFSIDAAIGTGVSASVSVGGSGGSAGDGGEVTAKNASAITTGGESAQGILAQSISMGGGAGGFSVSGSGATGISLPISIGGSGGAGGSSGLVTAENSGAIATSGNHSGGIDASSVASGGGHGGVSVAASFGVANASVSVGGSGGGGGTAQDVTVTNSGAIGTSGKFAAGISAMSNGGAGGAGGLAVATGVTFSAETPSGGLSVAIGGGGGGGGSGAKATVANSGAITTNGAASHAIFAQSQGGDGGKGGMALSGEVSIAVASASVSVAVGGGGGDANTGGAIKVTNTADLATTGTQSDAILAQSLGGDGGVGGFAGTLTASVSEETTFDAGVSVGGGGGDGGIASDVTVTNTGAGIATIGADSDAISAISLGGGGGRAGGAGSFNLSIGSNSTTASVAIGGAGGTGSTAGDVTVLANQSADGTGGETIFTAGRGSNGIFAKSLGGGGGRGGFSIVGDIAVAGTGTANQLGVSVGGTGGSGNTGGAVSVTTDQNIFSEGFDAAGIVALSIGGGGGNGGMAVTGSFNQNSHNLGVTVGGMGGDGGVGGTVLVDATGDITTNGIISDLVDNTNSWAQSGIYAQSIGGGGGTGGLSVAANLNLTGAESGSVNVGVTVGGSGGDGNTGGDVTVKGDGTITTLADNSFGVFAQSIGGSGGDGGASYNALVAAQKMGGKTQNITVAVGGEGGSGNSSGVVTIARSGAINTSGDGSSAIKAQSIGGGGGNGGKANTISLLVGPKCKSDEEAEVDPCKEDDTSSNFNLQVGVGGAGGDANDGNVVAVAQDGDLTTNGDHSHGIFAQSVGGGGGTGGNAHKGLPGAFGLGLAIGKKAATSGRSKGFRELSVEVGGNAGSAGDGKAVSIVHSGNIAVGSEDSNGQHSFGILAQSIGGGGGVGGAAQIGLTGRLGIGGKGGASGNGGDVSNAVTGDITTYGVENIGVFLQSVGGGGGLNLARVVDESSDFYEDNAGDAGSTEGFFGTRISLGASIGLGGGDGGNGGDIVSSMTGDVTTFGAGAIGVFAQSIGGGGGVGQSTGAVLVPFFAASNGDDGASGNVSITHIGNITTSGTNADGIFAQIASHDEDADSAITISLNGSISSSGAGSYAIHADGNNTADDSDGDATEAGDGFAHAGGGSIAITIAENSSVTGYDAGIKISGTAVTSVENSGTISANGGTDGVAISTTPWNARTINNTGTIIGDIIFRDCSGTSYLDDSTCLDRVEQQGTVFAVNNNVGGNLLTGETLSLGADNSTLTNSGSISPGGFNNIVTTSVLGDFSQTADGSIDIDVSLDGSGADQLSISGTANVAGSIVFDPVDLFGAIAGENTVTVLTAGELTRGDITLELPELAVLTDASLTAPSANEIGIQYTIDFAPTGLTSEESDVGDHIAAIQANGGFSQFSTVINSVFSAADLSDLASVYDGISPDELTSNSTTAVNSSLALSDAVHSCRQQDGANRFNSEGECVWSRVSLLSTRLDSSNVGNNREESFRWSLGLQKQISDDLYLGGSFSATLGEETSRGNLSTNTDTYHAGIVLKKVIGPAVLSGLVSGGVSQHQNVRSFNALGNQTNTAGETDTTFLSGQLRASYTFEPSKNFYVQPALAGTLTYTWRDAFTETGTSGFNLIIEDSKDRIFSIRPNIEFGTEFQLSKAWVARPFLRYDYIHNLSGSGKITARLAGSPDGVDSFTVNGSGFEHINQITLGARAIDSRNLVVRIEAFREWTNHDRTWGGGLKVALPF